MRCVSLTSRRLIKSLDSSRVAGILDCMETDLDKAREIVKKRVRFIERMGMMHENIAIAVAEGIALGRKEGIAMAAEAIARLKSENDASAPGDLSPMAAEQDDVKDCPDR
jgi:hypothetical protein